MSFWNASDKIPVKQTKVSIPAENGLNFQQNGRIHITIPPTIEFFQPKETYLSFDYLIDNTGISAGLQLDAELGGQVLIRDIRIFSGGSGAVLLEEIQNYNVITAVKYDYEADATLRNKRALTEAATVWSNNTRNTRGNEKTDLANVTHNPNHACYDGGSGPGAAATVAAGDTSGAQRKVKCLLPLHTGLFQNDKVFPSLLTSGLRVEIQLESAPRCLRMNDMNNFSRHNQHACLFHSADKHGGAAGGIDSLMGTTGRVVNGDVVSAIWVRRDNNQIGLENFPLKIGEKFNIVKNTLNPVDNAGDVATGIIFKDGALQVASLEWVVGGDSVTAGGNFGLVKITLEDNREGQGIVDGENLDGELGLWSIVSTDVSGIGQFDNVPGGVSTLAAPSWTTPATYQVSDVELIIQQLEMPAGYTRKMMSMMKAGGTLNYDFLSATNYKHSALKGDVVANIRLPLSQSRAKSILCVPVDATVYSQAQQISGYGAGILSGFTSATNTGQTYADPYDADKFTYQIRPTDLQLRKQDGAEVNTSYSENNLYSVRSGIEGIWDHLSHYQFFYDGRLNPSRRVECARIANKRSIAQQPLIELEKGLAMAGIRPLSFRKFNSNAVIGRALSLQNGVYDTRGKDFNLQVAYEESDVPAKNKLWNCYCFHLRRLSIKGNAISINV